MAWGPSRRHSPWARVPRSPWTYWSIRASSCSPATGWRSLDGKPVTTVEEAVSAAQQIGYPVVVKAQVLIGGRGKAGGVKLANNADEGA